MFLRKLFVLLACSFLLCASSYAATNFPYSSVNLKLPGFDDPYPGLGNSYSALGGGIRSALWNPAGLAKINVSEAYLGATATAPSSKYTKGYKVQDTDVQMGGQQSSSYINRVLFTNDLTAVNAATREFSARQFTRRLAPDYPTCRP